MIANIDGDLISFINAASAEGEPLREALFRVDKHVERILKATNTTQYNIFVSGGHNFRYDLYPNYKANRVQKPPEHRKACHQFLIREWNAKETNGYEADDALGSAQTEETITCSLDKDLAMIPGKHYSWPLIRKGKITRDEMFQDIDYLTGMKSFFRQALTGDVSDNIIGIRGFGPVKASECIDHLETEDEMLEVVTNIYTEAGRINDLEMNLDCLWIWRNLGETYSIRRIGIS